MNLIVFSLLFLLGIIYSSAQNVGMGIGYPNGLTIALPELAQRETKYSISLADFPYVAPKSFISFPINVSFIRMGDSLRFSSNSTSISLKLYAEVSEAQFQRDWNGIASFPLPTPSLIFSPPPTNLINSVQFMSLITLPEKAQTVARIVLYNDKDFPVQNYGSLDWKVAEPPSLWGALAAILFGPFIVFVMIHACCICCQQRKHKRNPEYNSDLRIPPYPYKGPPKPIFGCFAPLAGRFTQMIFNKPIHGYWTHYLNSHDFLWVWWPWYKEDRGPHWRASCALFFFLISFLFQQIWSAQMKKSLPEVTNDGSLLHSSKTVAILGFLLIDSSISVFKFLYRPLLRILTYKREEMVWANKEQPKLRKMGLAFTIIVALAFLGLTIFALYTVISFIMSTDPQFFQLMIYSFMIIIFWRSVVRGIIVSYIMYRFTGSYGKDQEQTYVTLPNQSTGSSYGTIPESQPNYSQTSYTTVTPYPTPYPQGQPNYSAPYPQQHLAQPYSQPHDPNQFSTLS